MSWAQWPAAMAAVNSAPAVLNPSNPAVLGAMSYSPEQWQQMQQQNWQQWAQWQQQYQQWHQQYGAEYQKTMTAMNTTQPSAATVPAVPVPPPSGVMPPLPQEQKPPLPPEEPPAAPIMPMPTFNASQPPPMGGFQQTPPVAPVPPPNPAYNKTQLPPSAHSAAPPPNLSNPPPNFKQQEFSNKRPAATMPQQNVTEAKRTRPDSATEELSESEKKFMKQFADWETQFNKWKEQNQDHPDKEQYREYEKKWEAWRNQLLERREQMRRKRLGITSGGAPDTKTQPPRSNPFAGPPPGQNLNQTNSNQMRANFPDQVQPKPFAQFEQNKPPPGYQPPNFQEKPPFGVDGFLQSKQLARESPLSGTKTPESQGDQNLFLNPISSTSGGIPGLDLTGNTVGNAEDEVKPEASSLMPKAADLEAISKNINTILGDQKLLSMLSSISKTNKLPETKQPEIQEQHKEAKSELGSEDMSRSSFGPDDSKNKAPIEEQNYDDYNDYNYYQEDENQEYDNYDGYNDDQNYEEEEEQQWDENEDPNFYDPEKEYGDDLQDEGNFNSNRNQNYDDFDGNEGPMYEDNQYERGNYNQDNYNRNAGPGRFDEQRVPRNQGGFAGNQNRNDFGPDDRFNRGFNRNQHAGGGFGGNSNQQRPFDRGDGFNNRPMGPDDRFRDHPPRFGGGPDPPRGPGPGPSRFEGPGPARFEGGPLARGPVPGAFGFDGNNPRGPGFEGNPPRGPDSFVGGRDSGGLQFEHPTGKGNDSANAQERDYFPVEEESVEMTAQEDETMDDLLTIEKVIDYDHKSKKVTEDQDEVSIEPSHLFDYRHKSASRIPLSDRPTWLVNTFRFIMEFQPSIGHPQTFARFAQVERFDYRSGPRSNRVDSTDTYNRRPNDDKYNRDDRDHRRSDGGFRRRSPEREGRGNRWPSENNRRRSPARDDRRPAEIRDSRRSQDRDNIKSQDRDQGRSQDKDNRRSPERDGKRSQDGDRRRSPVGNSRRSPDRDYKKSSDRDGRRTSSFESNRRSDDNRRSRNYENNRDSDRNSKRSSELNRGTDGRTNNNSKANIDEVLRFEPPPSRKTNVDESLRFEPPEHLSTKRKFEDDALESPSKKLHNQKVTMVDDLLNPPGRFKRPTKIVIIIRGPPGSGKTFLAKLIKDREVENGGSAPRILSLDDYFMVEKEKEVVENGKTMKIKEMVYEHEEGMETSYRLSLMKSYKKTIMDGYFNFIIVDNVNDKVKYFSEMWSFGRQSGFQVYVCQLELDVQVCTKRNAHGRTEAEVKQLVSGWEDTPPHYFILDVNSLMEGGPIKEVEMEVIDSDCEVVDENEGQACNSSKWDNFDCSIKNLAKLDGVSKPRRSAGTMEDYLQLEDEPWQLSRSSKPGQKRVRWADLEERKEQQKMRDIGFVVGQTNWDRILDPTEGESALTQTKYIDRDN